MAMAFGETHEVLQSPDFREKGCWELGELISKLEGDPSFFVFRKLCLLYLLYLLCCCVYNISIYVYIVYICLCMYIIFRLHVAAGTFSVGQQLLALASPRGDSCAVGQALRQASYLPGLGGW
jgi:hypothetical protein